MSVTWLKFDDPKTEGMDGEPNSVGEAEVSRISSTKRRTRSEAKKNEILEVAREQFLENGYAGTSIDSIVDILGGSKSTIYSHFSNKETLFAAVIRNLGHTPELPDFPVLDGNTRNELIAFAQDRQKRVLSRLNINIMRIVIAEAARQPNIAELYFSNAPEPTYRALKDYLKKAVARGDLAINDLNQAADEFLGGLLQHDILARLFGMKRDIAEAELNAKAQQMTDNFLTHYGIKKLRGGH